ncbi:glycosyltransferase [Hafnia alvei]|uniref:O-antigen biosynthesis glycosyltransferase WbnJ n=1 Tax=Hafnia alvei TaxID=569 RepID=A0A172WZU7_HAFAL|nr:glycosyltransferase [Hafnia alvei]ANF29889.1 O-antigen biosynthesis glycosyltransferase WbnJ [Hafnia alvei]TBM10229.1 glycosyltransferase [Hafnia alvei]
MRDLAVLIPVYNDQADLELTLSSIDEDNTNFTVYIIDDGSKRPIYLDYMNYKFRIMIRRLEKNSGITRALNYGIEIIKKDGFRFIARLDAGDLQEKNRLCSQYKKMNHDDTLYLLGSNVIFYDHNGNLLYRTSLPLEYENIKSKFFYKSCFIHPAVMMRTSLFDFEESYSTDFPAAEDYELFLRIARKYKSENIPDILIRCNDRVNGISLTKRNTQIRSVLKALKRHNSVFKIQWWFGVFKVIFQLYMPRKYFNLIKAKLS